MILITVFVRRMTKGMSNRFFIALMTLSVAAAVSDLIMELSCRTLPLTDIRLIAAAVFIYGYYICRAVSIMLYFFFIFSITGTWYRVRALRTRLILMIPFAVQMLFYITNPFTGAIFTVTADNGYQRGGMIGVAYAISMLYALAGTVYLLMCRKFLSKEKILSLVALYALSMAAAIFQYFFPQFLV